MQPEIASDQKPGADALLSPDVKASQIHRAGRAMARAAFRAALYLPGHVLEFLLRLDRRRRSSAPGVDARAAFHAWLVTRFGGGSLSDPAAARSSSFWSLGLLEGQPLELESIHDIAIPGPGGILRTRFYDADTHDRKSPALIFLHFGGGVLGDLDTCHTACTILARHGKMKVLSVEYRLAPEHKFPAAIDDTLAAYHWLRSHAAELGVDAERIAIGGDSAGGHLAAAACLSLLDSRQPLPRLQLLIYPVLEMDRAALPRSPFDESYPLTRKDMEWFATHYMRNLQDASDPLCSVARAKTLAGLPPVLLVQAGHDILFEEGRQFAARLKAEGIPHDRLVYPTLPHAFSAMSGGVPRAREALIEIAVRTGEALAGSQPPFKETDNA